MRVVLGGIFVPSFVAEGIHETFSMVTMILGIYSSMMCSKAMSRYNTCIRDDDQVPFPVGTLWIIVDFED